MSSSVHLAGCQLQAFALQVSFNYLACIAGFLTLTGPSNVAAVANSNVPRWLPSPTGMDFSTGPWSNGNQWSVQRPDRQTSGSMIPMVDDGSLAFDVLDQSAFDSDSPQGATCSTPGEGPGNLVQGDYRTFTITPTTSAPYRSSNIEAHPLDWEIIACQSLNGVNSTDSRPVIDPQIQVLSQQHPERALPSNIDYNSQSLSFTRKIMNINLKLCEHAATLPSLEVLTASANSRERSIGTDRQRSGSDLSSQDQHKAVFAIDQTFMLTRQFTEILKDGFEITSRSKDSTKAPTQSRQAAWTAPQDPSAKLQRSSAAPDAGTGLSRYTVNRDAGSLLLVISCYVRIIEIYDRIFLHLQRSASKGTNDLMAHLRLPNVIIGAFSTQSSGTLQALLFIQIAEQLLDCLREFFIKRLFFSISNETDACMDQEQHPNADVADEAFKKVMTQEAKVVRSMHKVRKTIQQHWTL